MHPFPVPEQEDQSAASDYDLSVVKSWWDSPREACGVYGIFSLPAEDVAKITYFGLYALQHRGQEAAGIVTFGRSQQGESVVNVHKSMGLVSQVFNEQILAGLTGYLAVGHNRYSTTGSNRVENAQPIVVDTRLGKLALAHNGNLVNTWELRAELAIAGYQFEATSDSEAIAWAIALEVDQGQDLLAGIIGGLRRCAGAFSLVIGTNVGLVGARDPHGVRPLEIGQLDDGSYILASETCGLDIVNAKLIRSVAPGELVWIDGDGIKSCFWQEQAIAPKLCIFEMIYFARPDSVMNHRSLYNYRKALGRVLAQEAAIEADLVIGVPDSGIPAAIGYSIASGIAYAEGLIKNRYVGRTFIQPTQAMRDAGIKMKLNPLRDELEGKRVVVIDDSIVRGTTSRKIVQALRDAGCTEVHMRISSPPVTHPCFYGIDTDSQDQLIAATKTVAEIAQIIGVDSLAFLSREGMLRATEADSNNFCTACFTGDYPIPVPDKIKQTKIALELNP